MKILLDNYDFGNYYEIAWNLIRGSGKLISVNVNEQKFYQETAEPECAIEVLKYMIQKDPSFLKDIDYGADQQDILSSAIQCGNLPTIMLLIENIPDFTNEMGLYLAVRYDHSNLVRIFLDRGANSNLLYYQTFGLTNPTEDDESEDIDPLELAVSNENIKIIKMLLAAGADPHFNNDAALKNARISDNQ